MLLSVACSVQDNTISDIWSQGVKMLGASSLVVTRNRIADTRQGIGLKTHPLGECRDNTVSHNMILNTGTPGSFGVRAPDRVPFGSTAGIDLRNSRSNSIVYNVIANDDPAAEMAFAFLTDANPNLRSGNLTRWERRGGFGLRGLRLCTIDDVRRRLSVPHLKRTRAGVVGGFRDHSTARCCVGQYVTAWRLMHTRRRPWPLLLIPEVL